MTKQPAIVFCADMPSKISDSVLYTGMKAIVHINGKRKCLKIFLSTHTTTQNIKNDYLFVVREWKQYHLKNGNGSKHCHKPLSPLAALQSPSQEWYIEIPEPHSPSPTAIDTSTKAPNQTPVSITYKTKKPSLSKLGCAYSGVDATLSINSTTICAMVYFISSKKNLAAFIILNGKRVYLKNTNIASLLTPTSFIEYSDNWYIELKPKLLKHLDHSNS